MTQNMKKNMTDKRNIFKGALRAGAALLCVAMLVLVIPKDGGQVHAANLTDSKVESYEAKLAQIEKDMKNLQKQISSAKTATEKAMADKEKLDGEMSLLIKRIDTTTEFIDALSTSISEKDGEIIDKQKAYDDKYALFKERLRVTREEGEASYLQMLFGAENLADFLSRVDRIGAMLEYDNTIMRGLKEDKASLENIRSDFATQKLKQEELLASLKKDEAELEEKSKQAASYINQYKNNTAQYTSLYEKALAEEEKLTKELEAYLEELQKKLNSKFVGGTFMWPVPLDFTRISSYYGWRTSPITGKSELHNGIDIPASYGTNIYASNDGKVTIATKHYSYGNYIMIDHGGGYATLYAHCSSLLVSVGQTVKKGQVIAKVGSTGYSTGNHLHFSLYEANKHTDPMKFFK